MSECNIERYTTSQSAYTVPKISFKYRTDRHLDCSGVFYPSPGWNDRYGDIRDLRNRVALTLEEAKSIWLPEAVIQRLTVKHQVMDSGYLPLPSTAKEKTKFPCSQPYFRKCVENGGVVMNPYHVSEVVRTSTTSALTEIVREAFPIRDLNFVREFQIFTGEVRRVLPLDDNGKVISWEWGYAFFGTIQRVLIYPYCRRSYLSLTEVNFGPGQPETPEITPKEIKTLSEVVETKNLADARSAIYDAATDIFEGRKSLESIGEALIAVYNKARSLRKTAKNLPRVLTPKGRRSFTKSVKSGKNTMGRVHQTALNTWMQWRYGIMPIVYSVKDIQKALNASVIVYKTTRSGDQITASKDPIHRVLKITSKSGLTWEVLTDYQVAETVKINAVTKAKIASTDLPTKISLYIPNGIWEIIPFSWVVDWVINVGDSIAATRPSCAILEVSCLSTKSTYSRVFKVSIPNSSFEESRFIEHGDYKLPYARAVYAKVYGDSSIISNSMTRVVKKFTPSINIDVNMNWKRSVDAWALIVQRVMRRR